MSRAGSAIVAAIPQRHDVHAAQLMVVIEVLTRQAPDSNCGAWMGRENEGNRIDLSRRS